MSSSAMALVATDNKCADVETVFARGSGEGLGSQENTRFFEQVSTRMARNDTTVHQYELGTEKYGGVNYPAVNVLLPPTTGTGAVVSAGNGFKYGKSVADGKKEFKAYLEARIKKCGSAVFVVGGYSQGAQVIREGLAELTNAQKNHIAFVALFGDPKLYLPEGEGASPPACRNKNLSPYRRVIGDCYAYSGILGAQKPFLSSNLSGKTGLWCNAHDAMCGTGSSIFDFAGHGEYAVGGRAIDLAVKEAATKVKAKLPAKKAGNIDDKPKRGDVTGGSDVVFVIDGEASMISQFPQIKKTIRRSAADLMQHNGRFALVLYGANRPIGGVIGGPPPDPNAITPVVGNTNFEDDPQRVLDALDSLQPNTNTAGSPLHALMTSLDNLHWRKGAAKSIVLFTNKPGYQSPDYNAYTTSATLKRALEVDPVSIFPVVPEGTESAYQELADLSSGRIYIDNAATDAAGDAAYAAIVDAPVVTLDNQEYSADPGQEITFDASDSYTLNSTITKYDWDFDGDLVFDQTTTTPYVNHAYTGMFDGLMQVRATTANGMTATGSAAVKIGTKVAPILPKAPLNVTVTAASGAATTATLSWTPADQSAASWMVSVNGVAVGMIAGNKTSIDITDLDRSNDVHLAVAAVTANNVAGESAATVLATSDSVKPCVTGTFLQNVICQLLAWYQALQQQFNSWLAQLL